MKKLVIILLMLLSFNTLANNKFLGCSNTEVKSHHTDATRIINNTVNSINNSSNYFIEKALNKYFNLSPSVVADQDLIKKVFKNIKRVALGAESTNYSCHKSINTIWCIADQLAIVPPPKDTVYLCPAFFNNLNKRKQIGTIIHEWFHRWGKSSINYFPESYCYESSDLSSAELVRNADQYMLFIYYVGTNGGYLECF